MDLSKFNTGLTVLVDMDETLVEFEKEFWKRWQEKFGHIGMFCYPGMDFDLTKCVPPEYANEVKKIWNDVGFFRCLEPIPGGIEALKEMKSQGINVLICSSPSFARTWSCKALWVKENMGVEWVEKLILTRDKTAVKGQYLIDDKPVITGAFHPEWQHILFDRPFNRKFNERRRLTGWENWRSIFTHEIQKKEAEQQKWNELIQTSQAEIKKVLDRTL